MKLYDSKISGNCYKIRLLLSHLGKAYESEEIDVSSFEARKHRPDGLLSDNPHGRVPALVLDDGRLIAESNAILHYLADGTPYLSDEPFVRAKTLQWMFWEQNSHESNIAVAKYYIVTSKTADEHPEMMARLRSGGDHALDVMNAHLESADFFAGNSYSIADIALFAYTHVADQAHFDLDARPALTAWLNRVRDQPGFIPM